MPLRSQHHLQMTFVYLTKLVSGDAPTISVRQKVVSTATSCSRCFSCRRWPRTGTPLFWVSQLKRLSPKALIDDPSSVLTWPCCWSRSEYGIQRLPIWLALSSSQFIDKSAIYMHMVVQAVYDQVSRDEMRVATDHREGWWLTGR
jgi:hypothetical protein